MKFSPTIFLITVSLSLHSQNKHDANWCFGKNAGINFNNPQSPQIFQTKSNNLEVAASISNKTGDLLFYLAANGANLTPASILDNQNQLIVNGDSINTDNSCTNCALIIPLENNEYYLFHIGLYTIPSDSCPTCFSYHFYYSRIRNNSRSLEVVEKNIPLLEIPVTGKLGAVKHSNGIDWWVAIHGGFNTECSDTFYRFLVQRSGAIQGPYKQNVGSVHCWNHYMGEMTFSRSGQKIALGGGFEYDGILDLCDFNRTSGDINNCVQLNYGIAPYGIEFSSNERFLYVIEDARTGLGGLYQYDLSQSNISSSRQLIWLNPNPRLAVGQLQIAPDNKIYFTTSDGSYNPPPNQFLGVINKPDSLNCDFAPFSFYAGDSSRLTFSLPNMPNYNLDEPEDTTTGVRENLVFQITVFPNPAQENFLVISTKSETTFLLYDLFGREVLITQLVTGKNQVETKNLTNGVYIYRVTGESKVGKVFIEK